MKNFNKTQSEHDHVVNPQQSLESTQTANTNDANNLEVEGFSTQDTAKIAVENNSANDLTPEADIVSGTNEISNDVPEIDEVINKDSQEQLIVVEEQDSSNVVENCNADLELPNSYYQQKQEERDQYESVVVNVEETKKDVTYISDDYVSEEFYNSLPNELQNFLDLYVGREKDIVFLSVLGVFSSLLPNVRGFYRGEIHHPNLFIQIIAPPASGKGKMKLGLRVFDKVIKQITKDNKDFRIPGNSSSVRVIEKLNEMHGFGNLMFETEADSISGTQKNEWGNFSDILRKAAQHENISISRKGNNVDINCEYPRLSLLISGTPDQLAPLIKSIDNGLFSRFVYYAYKDVSNWAFYKEQPNHVECMKILEDFFESKYLKMQESKITFRFSDEQQQNFDTFFADIAIDIISINPKLLSSVERLGYITFRIMMMFTLLDKDNFVENDEISENAFNSALLLVPILLEHIIKTSTIYSVKSVTNDRLKMFFDKLPDNFTSAELKISKNLGSSSTIDKNLKALVEMQKLEKVKHGVYNKI